MLFVKEKTTEARVDLLILNVKILDGKNKQNPCL